jgi:hypothetical protein
MTIFHRTPKTLRGAVVLLDPDSGQLKRIITKPFKPENFPGRISSLSPVSFRTKNKNGD